MEKCCDAGAIGAERTALSVLSYFCLNLDAFTSILGANFSKALPATTFVEIQTAFACVTGGTSRDSRQLSSNWSIGILYYAIMVAYNDGSQTMSGSMLVIKPSNFFAIGRNGIELDIYPNKLEAFVSITSGASADVTGTIITFRWA